MLLELWPAFLVLFWGMLTTALCAQDDDVPGHRLARWNTGDLCALFIHIEGYSYSLNRFRIGILITRDSRHHRTPAVLHELQVHF